MPSKVQLLPPDIGERLKDLPDRVAGIPGLNALWLFGSFARGEATPISDVDLAFLADKALQGEALEGFETELYATIARSLHTDEFTFVNLRQAPAALAWQVVGGGRLLFCRDEEECDRVRASVFQRFPDAHTYARERWQALDDWLEGKRMPVDKARVYALLEGMREELGYVGEIAAIPREAYLHDRRTQRLAERCLQRAAEGCISIGNHLIARLGLRAPSEYAEVFRILGEAKIVPWELVQQMVDMAKFRNLLVHVYWAIDHERVYDALQVRLAALESFARHIARWLQEHEGEGRVPTGGSK
jgi:uncharacterized protein YutE (UPF0331/DUF86 family)/predicted nucleotidyltransferase